MRGRPRRVEQQRRADTECQKFNESKLPENVKQCNWDTIPEVHTVLMSDLDHACLHGHAPQTLILHLHQTASECSTALHQHGPPRPRALNCGFKVSFASVLTLLWNRTLSTIILSVLLGFDLTSSVRHQKNTCKLYIMAARRAQLLVAAARAARARMMSAATSTARAAAANNASCATPQVCNILRSHGRGTLAVHGVDHMRSPCSLTNEAHVTNCN